MKPLRSVLSKDFLPIDVTRFELARRSVATIRTADSATNPKSTLGKVETITNRTPNTIVIYPVNKLCIDTSLQNKILN